MDGELGGGESWVREWVGEAGKERGDEGDRSATCECESVDVVES
jgi:hypothetical protein